jgi:hypothetical protein
VGSRQLRQSSLTLHRDGATRTIRGGTHGEKQQSSPTLMVTLRDGARLFRQIRMRHGITGFAVCLGLAAASPLAAQPSAANKAAAEALYQQGAELFEQGDLAPACEHFNASQDLDPGLGTMLRLADCLDRLGKTASAWALFREAATIAGERADTEREAIASRRASDLEQRLSRVWLTSAEAAPPAGLTVEFRGSSVPLTSLGVSLPLDPGPVEITARAEGYQPFTGELEVPEGPAQTSFEIPALVRIPPPKPVMVAKPVVVAPLRRTESDFSLRTAGYVGAGAGLVGIATGAIFAYRALQLKSDSLEACSATNEDVCGRKGYDLRNDSLTAADAATVGFGVGGALLLGGVALILLSPESAEKAGGTATSARLELSASPAPAGGNLELGGAF